MQQEEVKKHFRKQVAEYVGLMGRLVPQYMEQQKFLCELIPFDRNSPIHVLDLGSGPGVLSELVLKLYPQAKVLAFDLTREMLEACKQRLAAFEGRIVIRQGDFSRDSFGAGYDVILAGLTLHHLDHEQRREIYVRLYGALKSPGVFLAREVIVDDDPFVTEWHYSLWRSFMRANGEDDAFWFGKHREKDHPASVEQQSAWLRKAGFVHTACHWRYWNFAIIGGHKI